MQHSNAPTNEPHMMVLRARPTALSQALKYGLPLVAVLGIGGLIYLYVTKTPTQVVVEDHSLPKVQFSTNDADAIKNENTVQKVDRIPGSSVPTQTPPPIQAPVETIPPPPPDKPVEVKKPETKTEVRNDASGIVGESLALGPLSVQIENYWTDDDKKNVAYSVLSGSIQNASDKQMTVPQMEVVLLDNDKRQYKPSKSQIAVTGPLNPLVKTKAVWFFELPPSTPMYCAQFTLKQGKNTFVAYIRLAERTPENLELMNDQDYQAAFVELMLQASPRVKAQEAYYKAKAALDLIGDQMDDLKEQATKLEKKLKVANDAADSAKAGVEKAKKDSENVKAWMKEISSNTAKFGHNQRLQDIEMGKAENQAQRCIKAEQSANDTLKTKLEAKAKLDGEMKDLVTKLKALAGKYETQEKAVDKLKEKIE